jgi:hypothetical protein
MTRNQLEKRYEINGLTDYKLRSTEDLLKVHGIDFREVAGYSSLDDINRAIYEKFIVNIFNAWGLDSRLILIPKGIYFVEDTEYLVKVPEDDYYTVAGQTIYTIDRSGNKQLLHRWEDDEYKHLMKTAGKPKHYLRFEYQHGTDSEGNPRNEWLHVIKDGEEWY